MVKLIKLSVLILEINKLVLVMILVTLKESLVTANQATGFEMSYYFHSI